MRSKRDDPNFKAISQAAHKRVVAVLRCLDALVPNATPRQRKRLANKILALCDGKDRSVRITQQHAQALISPHMQCLARNCPELVFWQPISQSLNMFFNEEE